MKEGWTYRKLGEICSPKEQIKKAAKVFAPCDEIKYIDISSIDNNNRKMTGYTKYVMSDAPSRAQQCVQKGDILVSTVRPNLKNIAIVESNDGDLVASSGFCVLRPEDVERNYLFHYISSDTFTSHLTNLTTGANYPAVRDSDILNSLIPIPTKSLQRGIVDELDKINELIRLKKEQLREYDNLAQSIFYEMFGDPVENDRGWNVERLSNVSTLLNGRAYSQNELLDEGKYKVLRVGNFFTNGNYYYSNLELEDDKYCYNGDLLFAWSASFGAFIWDGDKTIYHYHIWKVLFDKGLLNIHYYRFLLNAMTSSFMKDVHGIGMIHLTKAGMEQYELPIPPLDPQEAFAEKIRTIELQKAAVVASIKELETLLESRMQYWFVIQPVAEQIIENMYTEDEIKDRYTEFAKDRQLEFGTIKVQNGHPRGCTDNDMDFKLLADILNFMKETGTTSLEAVESHYSYTSHARLCVLELRELGYLESSDYKTFNIPQ